MKKVTVSKLQIAQAEECVARMDKYVKHLNVILTLCELAKPHAAYNQLPEDFKINQKKSLEVIAKDIKSMMSEASEVALNKAEKAVELRKKREAQLNEGGE